MSQRMTSEKVFFVLLLTQGIPLTIFVFLSTLDMALNSGFDAFFDLSDHSMIGMGRTLAVNEIAGPFSFIIAIIFRYKKYIVSALIALLSIIANVALSIWYFFLLPQIIMMDMPQRLFSYFANYSIGLSCLLLQLIVAILCIAYWRKREKTSN